jgi:teichuronic acid biosynthesis glycosyltransferase TuaH
MVATTSQPPTIAPAASSAPRGDVVFTFSYMTWQGAAQRDFFMPEDRMAQSLLAHERVRGLLIGDTFRSLPVKLVRDRLNAPVALPDRERTGLLQPVRLRRDHPVSIRGVERAFADYDRALRRKAEQLGLEDPVVITAHPLLAGFADLNWARAVTFYAVDDWSMSPPYKRWWAAYEEAYRRIRERGLRIGAVSPGLREKLASGSASVVVPNGLEPSEWVGEPTPPAWLAGLPRPLLVYLGTLDARLNVRWLAELAAALPQATVLLAGPVGDARGLEPLRAIPNVQIRPGLGRREYAGLLRSADVGLIPHVRSPLTESIEPQKIYEYLAGGLPVVATDLPPVRGIDPRVLLVPEHDDFAEAVGSAWANGRAAEDQRLRFVDANSWRARHDRLVELALS